MKFSLSKNKLLSIYFFLFIFILIKNFIGSIVVGFSKESWNITEFLINYEGGFVRRGLLGSIILNIYHLTGLNPYALILLICGLAYLALVLFFVRSFVKKGYPLFVLPFGFFLGNPIIGGFWVRKDTLIILIFISIIYFAVKKSNWSLILVNLFFILGLLIHESIGFFCFPILTLILLSKNKLLNRSGHSFIKPIVISVSQLLPSILTFLCVLYFKGSKHIADQIWNSWKPIAFPIQDMNDTKIPAAIDGISWSLKEGLSVTVDTLKDFKDNIYSPFAWTIILAVIYYILTNTDRLDFKIFKYKSSHNFNKSNISNSLIFQLLTIVPLFILGCDYGRWVFYWVTSSFAVILLVPEKELSGIFPRIVLVISTRVNSMYEYFLNSSNTLLLSILIGFPRYSWGIMPCITSNSFYLVLNFFSRALYYLLSILKTIL